MQTLLAVIDEMQAANFLRCRGYSLMMITFFRSTVALPNSVLHIGELKEPGCSLEAIKASLNPETETKLGAMKGQKQRGPKPCRIRGRCTTHEDCGNTRSLGHLGMNTISNGCALYQVSLLPPFRAVWGNAKLVGGGAGAQEVRMFLPGHIVLGELH